MTGTDDADRRARRLRDYADLRADRPELFANPPGGAYTIELGDAAQAEVAAARHRFMREAGLPVDYGDVGVIYQDEYLTLVRDAVRFRDGRLGSYIRVVPAAGRGTGGCAVLPLVDDGVLLARHFRQATRTWLWEAPRGFPEPGEEPAAAAARELTEELGLVPDELVHLGAVHPDAGISAAAMDVFAARVTGSRRPDRLEGIDEVRHLPAAELDRWIADGRISDAVSLSAIALARSRGMLP
ncbi:MAG TPA: NUDIX hydrolase [Streptosporangiaceae bacterium]